MEPIFEINASLVVSTIVCYIVICCLNPQSVFRQVGVRNTSSLQQQVSDTEQILICIDAQFVALPY